MRIYPLTRRRNQPFATNFDLERLFEDFLRIPFRLGLNTVETLPSVDIYEKDSRIVAKAEIPGISPDDIALSVDGNILTISGERRQEKEVKKENYYQSEASYGRFQRTVELPAEVNAEQAKAEYKNGVLTVELPNADITRKKHIKIEVK